MFNSFFFNDTATTEIYTLSLHDALPIFGDLGLRALLKGGHRRAYRIGYALYAARNHNQRHEDEGFRLRSEEHTSELQSRQYLVCRLLLEKKNTHRNAVATC